MSCSRARDISNQSRMQGESYRGDAARSGSHREIVSGSLVHSISTVRMYQSDSVYAFGWKSIALWVDVYISTASAHELAFYNNTFLCMLYKLS